ncbi:MAG: hypothetical protein HOO96_05050 [Polyangiaceae bacterium]|nr:hypothetical protein [Polyangiaceae bacterium]
MKSRAPKPQGRPAAPTTETPARSGVDRRKGEDRRAFPPRPEGRRMNDGRRESDPPVDA